MSVDLPSISVLMPVYNAERYLAEAVESILNQSFGDFEFIIINDGSTDGSLAILERYAAQDDRIRLFNRENKGITPTLNEGIALARAPFIARMDADDISLPERFEKQYAYMEAHPECVACGAWYKLVDEDGDALMTRKVPEEHDAIDSQHLQGSGGAICHPASIIQKAALQKVNGYRSEYIHAEDLDLFLRLAEMGQLHNLQKILIHYKVHTESISHIKKILQRENAIKAVQEACVRRKLNIYGNATLVKNTQERNTDLSKKWAWWALNDQNIKTARKHAWRTFRRDPFSKESWRVLYCALRGY